MLAAMAVLVTTSAKVGRTALNKLLWFADVAHFLQHGRTISGTVYVKCDYGPAPCDIDAVRHELIARGIVSEKIIKATPYRSFVYKANDAAIDANALEAVFAETELRTMRAVIGALRKQTVGYLSEMSHQFEPWISSSYGEEMDLSRACHDDALREWLAKRKAISLC